ncbi:MAG: glycosyltransferase family 2 protein [Candidatus Melainabacteria bacterium]|nr:glycosyltransferase family 2 protein [Candidatus Melainabacteria bacterium]
MSVALSVISPVYKAQNIIDELVKRIKESALKVTHDFEIILVDDCSPDDSWLKIEENCKKDQRVKGIKLSRNFGQHKAITAGLEESKGDYVVVIDCDLQHDPVYIPEMYKKALDGYDIVYTKMTKIAHSFIRNICSKMFSMIFNWLTDNNFSHETIGSYSLLSRKVVNSFSKIKDSQRHYLLVLRWLGFKYAYLDVEHKERYESESSYSFKKLFSHALDGIISQSDKLLRLSISIGFIFSFLSVIMIILLVFSYFLYGFKEGWTSIISVILLSTGLLLISIGILGIYIAKIFEQVKNRPLYLIDKRLNF